MGRYSPRRSRSPPRRRPYDDPRERSSRRPSPAPTGLLVRNIPLDARSEDLRIPFERFGPVKDVYLPKNYYTGEPRGFGFVKFRNPEDAAEAKYQLNHTLIGGREIAIVFAEENRKTPQEMRTTSRGSGRYGGTHRRRSPPRSPRRRYNSYSRSPSPRHDFSHERIERFSCPKKVITKEGNLISIHVGRSRKILDWNSHSHQSSANKSVFSEFKEMGAKKAFQFLDGAIIRSVWESKVTYCVQKNIIIQCTEAGKIVMRAHDLDLYLGLHLLKVKSIVADREAPGRLSEVHMKGEAVNLIGAR